MRALILVLIAFTAACDRPSNSYNVDENLSNPCPSDNPRCNHVTNDNKVLGEGEQRP